MSLLRPSRLSAAALGLCLLLARPASAGTGQAAQISLRIKDPVVRAHAAVYATLAIVNPTAGPVEVDLGTNGQSNLELRIFDERGTLLKEARVDPDRSLSIPGDLTVKPGTSFTAEYLLNEWHTFSAPGKYRIEGRILAPVEGEAGPVPVETLGRMDLEVLPSSAEDLRQVAGELAQQAVRSTNYRDVYEAVFVLSRIEHPVVVPSLRLVLQKAPFRKDLAVEALARVGSREAVEELIATLSGPDLAARDLAAQVLWKRQIAIGEKYPDLLEKVQEAIRPFFMPRR